MSKDGEELETEKRVVTLKAHSRWRCLILVLQARTRLITTIRAAAIVLPPPQHFLDLEEALIPTTPTTVVEVVVDNNPNDVIDYNLQSINKIIRDKNASSLYDCGGASTFAEVLGTDLENGIPKDHEPKCCRESTSKALAQAPKKGFVRRFFRCSNNYIIPLLVMSGILSLGFGIKESGPKTGWVQGFIILIAAAMLIVLPLIHGATGLNKKVKINVGTVQEKEAIVDVVRGGDRESIPMSNVLVGDIVWLKSGRQIPGDGLLISDGSVLELDDDRSNVDRSNPFLFYGTEVRKGEGKMLVVAVGENTAWAEAMITSGAASLDKTVSLTTQLDKVTTWKQIAGIAISVVIVGIVVFLRFEFANDRRAKNGIPEVEGKPLSMEQVKHIAAKIVLKGNASTLITSLTMLLVGVVEGFPFIINVATLYWKKIKGLDFAQNLSACVAMGSATIICTDLVGGLTSEPLEVRNLNDVDDLIRTKIKDCINVCRCTGVRIILVPNEEVDKLVTVAREFGIISQNIQETDIVMEGEEFRQLNDEERVGKAIWILVTGNDVLNDKLQLVESLKNSGETVCVIGKSTNDAPALKAADVGLAFEGSTSVARESADIILRGTNIGYLVAVFSYGRCIIHNIRNLLKLELTMFMAGLLVGLISMACTGNMPITTIQSCWVNLVVPMLGGLALLTEQRPSENLMKPPTWGRREAMITPAMWASIAAQSVYQAGTLLAFQFKIRAMIGLGTKVGKTIVFNSFVLCQVFNQLNAREVISIRSKYWFWVVLGVTVVLQVIFIEMAHFIASNARLNVAGWGICFAIATGSLVVDFVEKLILGFVMG